LILLHRIVESTLRTMSNLLERLHASFFFYVMSTPGQFLKIGMYIPSAILVGAALMFGGLGAWVKAGWTEIVDVDEKQAGGANKRWVRRPRNIIPALQIVLATHVIGTVSFWLIQRSFFMLNLAVRA